MEATKHPTPKPRHLLADCDCGCTFWYGPHDDYADRVAAEADALYDRALALRDPRGDTPDYLKALDAAEAREAEANRLLAMHRGLLLRCPRCLTLIKK